MSLWLKPFSLATRLSSFAPAVQRLTPISYEAKRTAFTSNKRVRVFLHPKRKRPVVKDEAPEVLPSQLYTKEIGTETFEARQDDLPDFEMSNPFSRDLKMCILCKHNITPDYKNTKLLSQFVSPHTGEVYGRHITGLCKIQQERVESEISKSRNAGLMAYYFKHVEFSKDPQICDPLRPTRPHPY